MDFFLTDHFKRQVKFLAKKFPHVKDDLILALRTLDLDHEVSIGRSIYKIRIKSRDLKKGKSGGFRAYLYFYRLKSLIVPVCVYAKSYQSDLSDNELQHHFDHMLVEIMRL